VYGPLPHNLTPDRLDPDHDRILGITDQIRDAAASHLLHDSFKLLIVLAAASTLAGWYTAGRILRRLTNITDAARRAGATTLHERLNLSGPHDELKELADTFDAMLERLDTAFAANKRFVANASHELRTPLAVTRTALEVTLAKPTVTDTQWRATAADIAHSTDRAQQLIDALLTLARSEQAVADPDEDDFADLAAEALDQITPAARARHLRPDAALAPAPVHGNVALLRRAVANLLENAVKYNNDAGALAISTRTHGALAELCVTNDGPSVPADTVPLLFEPFHRGVHTRAHGDEATPPGAGLGLSIVHAVATAHGGTLTAHARPAGGLTVILRLPTHTAKPDLNRTPHPPSE
jgi:signal transduction histidine kinase